MKNYLLVLGLLCWPTLVLAGSSMSDSGTIADSGIKSRAEMALRENVLEVQLESGAFFAPTHELNYLVLPQYLSLNWNLDDIGNDTVANGWFRGNTQFKFSIFGDGVVEGPESRFVGLMVGPQYNFVQPHSNWVPFVGARVGVGFTDSQATKYAQGQDFIFTFVISTGVRYYITDKWSLALEANYQHISNGGLSEPARENRGLDMFGPSVSVVRSF